MRHPPDHKLHACHHLVAACATLAKAEGFAATPLRRLTAAAGRTTGALYALFDSKDQLLRAIIEQELEHTLHRLGGDPPPERGRHAPDPPAAPAAPADLDALHLALAVAHVQAAGTPALAVSAAEDDTALAVLVTPPADRQPRDESKPWFRARSAAWAYWPWWAPERKGK